MLKQNDMVRAEKPIAIEERRDFLMLPLAERRRILCKQAEDAAGHYESEPSLQEGEDWQGGDVVEY